MKNTLLMMSLLATQFGFSQLSEVKFHDATFENGMTYPKVTVSDSKEVEQAINEDLLKNLEDVKANDFCIGQYGYVQKSTHLQIMVHCNCIDFDESQNRFFLYNIETGENVPYSDLIDPKKKADASSLITDKVKTFAETNYLPYTDSLAQSIQESTFDAFNCEMKRDGIEVWPKDSSWKDKRYSFSWPSLKSVLKFHFI